MKTLKVPDMHCNMCVGRIERALGAAGIASKVTLTDKTVEVEDGQEKEAVRILDELGFDAK